jgi:hypothetical protein
LRDAGGSPNVAAMNIKPLQAGRDASYFGATATRERQ